MLQPASAASIAGQTSVIAAIAVDWDAARTLELGLPETGVGSTWSSDGDGRLTAFHRQIAAQPTSPNLPFVGEVLFKDGVDFMTTTGAVDHPYAIENFKLESTNVDAGADYGLACRWELAQSLRAESALDELAFAAGRDAVDSAETCW